MLDNPAVSAALELDQVNAFGQIQLSDILFPFRSFALQAGDSKTVDADNLHSQNFVPALELKAIGIGNADFAAAAEQLAGVPGQIGRQVRQFQFWKAAAEGLAGPEFKAVAQRRRVTLFEQDAQRPFKRHPVYTLYARMGCG